MLECDVYKNDDDYRPFLFSIPPKFQTFFLILDLKK